MRIVVKIEREFHFRFYELVSRPNDDFGGSKIDGIRDKHWVGGGNPGQAGVPEKAKAKARQGKAVWI